ncbi:MAG: DUF547 domain-containing protein [Eudoraea sp.]
MLPNLLMYLVILLLPFYNEGPNTWEEPPIYKQQVTNEDQWNLLLKQYVDAEGNVDYKALKNKEGKLDAYLEDLAQRVPDKNWTKAKTIAFYINLYNAATVKLIVKNYPLNSIGDLKNPWKKKWINQNGKILSLSEIEHSILRNMEEPRIHFAINCASISCPKLLNEAFEEATLEKQLDKAAKDFIRDSSKNIISKDEIRLSKIFDWYKKDFETDGSLIDYLNTYLESPINQEVKKGYLKYNWNLNETKS